VEETLDRLYASDRFEDYVVVEALATETLEALVDAVQARIATKLGRPGPEWEAGRLPQPVFRGATRFEFGGPELPSVRQLWRLRELLPLERIGMSLTDACRFRPATSTAALVVHHPAAIELGAPCRPEPNPAAAA
jgi:5-methyltetrahydrofolate--homocysteine methyltransferase